MIATMHGVLTSMRGLRAISEAGLILHYNTFDTSSYNGSGNTIFDLTENGLDGTMGGFPAWSTNYFTFENDYILTPDLASVLTEIHSVELWVYPTGNGVLVQANGQAAPDTAYHHSMIEIVAGKLEFGLWDGTGILSTGPTLDISFNEWHQIVLTYDGTTFKGYLDGQLAGSAAISWDSPLDDTGAFYLTFGFQDTTSQGDGTYFDGRFGVMRVYDVALTSTQISQNFGASTGNVSPLVTDQLSLYYDPLNTASYSGAGNLVYNLAPTSLTGTLSFITYTPASPFFTFNSVDSQVEIADNVALESGAGSLSVEVWVRFASVPQTAVIIGKYDDGGRVSAVSYALRMTEFGGVSFVVGNGSMVSTGGLSPTFGIWNHLVGVFDRENQVTSLYWNRLLVETKPCTLNSLLDSSNPLYIGSYNGGEKDEYLDGNVGVVRIYKKALTQGEVIANYNSTRGNYP